MWLPGLEGNSSDHAQAESDRAVDHLRLSEERHLLVVPVAERVERKQLGQDEYGEGDHRECSPSFCKRPSQPPPRGHPGAGTHLNGESETQDGDQPARRGVELPSRRLGPELRGDEAGDGPHDYRSHGLDAPPQASLA